MGDTLKNLNKYPQVREVPFTKKDLIDFEEKIVSLWEDGQIRAPVHLSNGNEDELIEVFSKKYFFENSTSGMVVKIQNGHQKPFFCR